MAQWLQTQETHAELTWSAPAVAATRTPPRLTTRTAGAPGTGLGATVLTRAVEALAAAMAAVAAVAGLMAVATPLAAITLVPASVLAALAGALLLFGRPAGAAHAAGVAVVPFGASVFGVLAAVEGAGWGTVVTGALAPAVLMGLVVVLAWGAEERRRHAWGERFQSRMLRVSAQPFSRTPAAAAAQPSMQLATADVWGDVR